jgi:hypothetical protein
MNLELSKEEINIIIIGMTGSQYPLQLQTRAYDLVMKLRDKLREAT